jgi:flavorubredoxin
MKAIVLFDTLFGNTERIANCLMRGLQEAGVEAECVNISVVARVEKLAEYDLIALGAPTQYITASKPMKVFLDRLKADNLKGKYGFAFETKLESIMSGSAAKFIEKKLKDIGIEIIKPRSSAIVIGRKEKKHEAKIGDAVLKEGMEELFEKVGRELGVLLLQGRAQKVGGTM